MDFGTAYMVVMMLVLGAGFAISLVGSTYEVSPLDPVVGVSDQPTDLNLPLLSTIVPDYSPWVEDIKRKKSKACKRRRQARENKHGRRR